MGDEHAGRRGLRKPARRTAHFGSDPRLGAREVMDPEEPGQVVLHIELREGFADHTVVVTVDGREVFHRSEVTTDEESGMAAAIQLVFPSGVVPIAIAVTPGDRQSSFDVDLRRSRHVWVSLVGSGTVCIEVSSGRSAAM